MTAYLQSIPFVKNHIPGFLQSDIELLDSIESRKDYSWHRSRILSMDPTTVNSRLETPLMIATQWGGSPDVKALLDKGADVNAKDKDGWSPLLCAARDNSKVIDTLLEAGADMNATVEVGGSYDDDESNQGWTPLHLAVWNSVKATQTLLKAGADVNVTTESGNTPLHLSALNVEDEQKSRKIISTLCDAGADVTIRNKNDDTAFELAFAENRKNRVLGKLIKEGSQFDYLEGDDDQLYLHQAAKEGKARIALTLLKSGANPWQSDNDRKRPIAYAIKRGAEICFVTLSLWERSPTFTEVGIYERGEDNRFLQKDGKPVELTLLRDSKTNNLYQQESHIRIAVKAAFAFIMTPLFMIGAMGTSLISIITDLGHGLRNLPSLYKEEGMKQLLKRVALDPPKALFSRVFEAVSMPFKAIAVWGAALYAQYDPNFGRKWINDIWGEGNLLKLSGLAPHGNLSQSLINGRTKFYLNTWK